MADSKDSPKPPARASFLAGILKNARATPRYETTKAGLETRFCSNCGANREEGSDLTKCDYCGASFREAAKPTCAKCGAVRAPGSDPTKCAFCGALTGSATDT